MTVAVPASLPRRQRDRSDGGERRDTHEHLGDLRASLSDGALADSLPAGRGNVTASSRSSSCLRRRSSRTEVDRSCLRCSNPGAARSSPRPVLDYAIAHAAWSGYASVSLWLPIPVRAAPHAPAIRCAPASARSGNPDRASRPSWAQRPPRHSRRKARWRGDWTPTPVGFIADVAGELVSRARHRFPVAARSASSIPRCSCYAATLPRRPHRHRHALLRLLTQEPSTP